MSDNQQPFSPPLTAEERDAWDLVYMGCCVQNTVESSAKHADEAIHERRRRFGVPVPTTIPWPPCPIGPAPKSFTVSEPDEFKRPEIDTLRAEVETLKEQHREDLLRAEQAEVSRDHFRRAYHIRNEVIEAVRKAFHDNLGFRNAETRMAFYQVKDVWDALEQLDAYMRGASAADPVDELRAEVDRLTKGRDDLRVLLNSAREQTNAQPGERLEHAIQVIIDRAEKAEAELAECKKANLSLWEEASSAVKQRDAARTELAAARPVLEAVVRWHGPGACPEKAGEQLRIYANANLAKRAGGAT